MTRLGIRTGLERTLALLALAYGLSVGAAAVLGIGAARAATRYDLQGWGNSAKGVTQAPFVPAGVVPNEVRG